MVSLLASAMSRRVAVGRMGAGGAVALLAVRAFSHAIARDASPAASPAALTPLLQSWVDAWNAADVKALAALYTADALWEDVPSGAASKEGDITGFINAFIPFVADIEVTPRAAFAATDWAVLEYLFAATNKGFVPGAEAQGKPFAMRIATVFELSVDKIRRSSDYYDSATILTQVGVLPGPGATPTA